MTRYHGLLLVAFVPPVLTTVLEVFGRFPLAMLPELFAMVATPVSLFVYFANRINATVFRLGTFIASEITVYGIFYANFSSSDGGEWIPGLNLYTDLFRLYAYLPDSVFQYVLPLSLFMPASLTVLSGYVLMNLKQRVSTLGYQSRKPKIQLLGKWRRNFLLGLFISAALTLLSLAYSMVITLQYSGATVPPAQAIILRGLPLTYLYLYVYPPSPYSSSYFFLDRSNLMIDYFFWFGIALFLFLVSDIYFAFRRARQKQDREVPNIFAKPKSV